MARQPEPLVVRLHNHTQARYDSSGQVISPSQRPLPDNTQHSQETNIPPPPAGFEPAIPASKRPQTYALDCAATSIGKIKVYIIISCCFKWFFDQTFVISCEK
jgi:hypothetical protein